MNNKAVLMIVIIFTLLLVGGMTAFFFIMNPPSRTPSTTDNGQQPTGVDINSGNSTVNVPSGTQNSGNQNQGGIAIPAETGGTVVVKDFKKDPETQPFADNSLYYLAGGLTPTPANNPFSIFYAEADKSFHITLLQTPLGDVRKAAEKALLTKLNISETQLCSLVVYVGVPADVSEEYAGMELGMSFCPGSVSL